MRSSLLPGLLLAACSGPVDPPAAESLPLAAEALDRSVQSATIDPGEQLLQSHCSACHSLALVAQNRMSRDNWRDTIRWMQQKQGLWDLGEAEGPILDYLAREYGVSEVPWRRKPLEQLGSE